ncbi:metallophosphoesterase [Hasllibacter sp. MH4015]|uniref:metallophosphoesterase n=1 Tax=Hasllibacter sp. MH4015 TaxID=2854029 RepID=UPI001CD7937C|nr:metallophosphoesterase [Hasllibacter sp. MH4015]
MGEHFDKALIFTDLHIVSEGETIIGLDPLARFSEGLAHALDRHPDAQHLILLGDLTHTGAQAEYDRLIPVLADCPVPITVTMGNHDTRAILGAAFPGALNADGFAQTALDLGPLRLLVLDTHDDDGQAPLEHDGWLCKTRLAWLDAELARAARDGRDVVVFTHHPPCPVGFWAMDAIGLANADALLDRLHAAPHVKHLICGHIHRTIHASAGGLPVTILKSPCHQNPMILGQGTFADSVDEPGAYGILLALDDTIVVHTEDFALSSGKVQRYK